jgi:hypothetical protein
VIVFDRVFQKSIDGTLSLPKSTIVTADNVDVRMFQWRPESRLVEALYNFLKHQVRYDTRHFSTRQESDVRVGPLITVNLEMIWR